MSRIWAGDSHENPEIVSNFGADVHFSGRSSVAFMITKEFPTLVWLSRAGPKLTRGFRDSEPFALTLRAGEPRIRTPVEEFDCLLGVAGA